MAKNDEEMGPTSGLTPHLTVKGGREAIEFYKKAFGAKVRVMMPGQDGKRLMHAHLIINDSSLMLADDFPEFHDGKAAGAPTGVTLHLQVKNADKVWEKAVAAGAKVRMPLADMFWGDRYGQIMDPFGHTWAIGATLKGAARKAALASNPMAAPPPEAKKAPAKKSKKK
ncbi:MAG: VOC family protein [Terricaulis silvestris]